MCGAKGAAEYIKMILLLRVALSSFFNTNSMAI